MFAPRPDRKAQAYEGGEEVRKVETERDRPVAIARRERKVGARSQPLDLNRTGGLVDRGAPGGEARVRGESQGDERVGEIGRASCRERGEIAGGGGGSKRERG